MQQDDMVVPQDGYTRKAFTQAKPGDTVAYVYRHMGKTGVRNFRISECKYARHEAWVRRSFVDVDAPMNEEYVFATLVWGELVGVRRSGGLSKSEPPSEKRTNGSPVPALV